MSFHTVLDSLEEIHSHLIKTLLDHPDCEATPRGMAISELIGASFTLTNPRNRLILNESRATNYGFGVGEFCWYMRADRDLGTIRYYNKRMTRFSDDGLTINSAYGFRMFRARWGHESQLDNVLTELKSDPHSRRAVIHINEPSDLRKAVTEGSNDVPCTMSLQFLIRNRRLYMNVVMRSNDVIWGLPYDVFSFTMLMECVLLELQGLGVQVDDLGEYSHFVGSLHLYESQKDLARRILDSSNQTSPMASFDMAEMEDLVFSVEPLIRDSAEPDAISFDSFIKTKFKSETINWMIKQIIDHRNKRVREATK